MPLAHRIIPTILCRGRTLVKGKQFDSWRSVGVAAQAVRIQAMRGVDEICLLDIGATPEGRGPNLALIEELSDVLFCPLAVGGGIRTVEDVRALLRAGADSVVIGSAVPGSRFLGEAAAIVGSQAIVVAVDVKDGNVWTRCGTNRIQINPAEYAYSAQICGAGEILLTSIEREGTLKGYDLDLIRQVSEAVTVPVIANGGCSGPHDMAAAIEAGASAVAAGALFQFTDETPRSAAEYLSERGIEVRI